LDALSDFLLALSVEGNQSNFSFVAHFAAVADVEFEFFIVADAQVFGREIHFNFHFGEVRDHNGEFVGDLFEEQVFGHLPYVFTLSGELHLQEGGQSVGHVLVDGVKLQFARVDFECFDDVGVGDQFAFFDDLGLFLLQVFGGGEGEDLLDDDFGSGDGGLAEGVVIVEEGHYHTLGIFYCKFIIVLSLNCLMDFEWPDLVGESRP